PSNILITPHDHAKLLDLGLALWEGERGSDRSVIGGGGYVGGTMDYISPEQARGPTRGGARPDPYGLGGSPFFTPAGPPPAPPSPRAPRRRKPSATSTTSRRW